MEKKCLRCGIIKPLELFYKRKDNEGKHLSYCIECFKKMNKEYKKTNGSDQRHLEKIKEILKENPEMTAHEVRVFSETKKCVRCGIDKPKSRFYRRTEGKHRTQSYCIECLKKMTARYKKTNGSEQRYQERNREKIRIRALVNKYGITQDEYEKRYPKDNLCEICGRRPTAINGKEKRLFVEHNHKTGKVRGFVCNRCNSTIGFCGEDTSILLKIVDYLNREKPQTITL